MALVSHKSWDLHKTSIHAGKVPITRTGDWSDVTVVDADGNRIPWTEVSHINDDEMRDLMRDVVNRLYTFLMSDNHLGRCRQPPWPVGLDGRRACPSGGQPHRPD
ncbi:hypothetical protein RNZ50_26040 [Paracoccaceae bacterium Fryx2]|nr:hypothetical protein [Paracoccaceae bacterium Fryx2]